MAASDVMNMIKEKNVKFVDFRFTDTQGKEQHVSVPSTLSMKMYWLKARCSTVLQFRAGKVLMHQT